MAHSSEPPGLIGCWKWQWCPIRESSF